MYTPVFSPAALASITLGFAQDEFLARDAEADAAHDAVSDFCTHAKLYEQGCVRVLADLNERAYESEIRRRHARAKLRWEWCHSIRDLGRQAPEEAS